MTSLSKAVEFVSQVLDGSNGRPSKAIVFGISGPQGSGKTYLADNLVNEIAKKYPTLNCVKFSMDDLYLTHAQQEQLTKLSILDDNKLLQGRGLPGTHDINLCVEVLTKLTDPSQFVAGGTNDVAIPVYDKSAFSGEGDRVSFLPVKQRPDLIVFEGWFNGYSAIDGDQLRLKYFSSIPNYEARLPKHKLYQVEDINTSLKDYEKVWNFFDYFIFIDSDFQNVLKWRLEQEHTLILKTGSGMTDDQVVRFVDRYIPIYELYYDTLRSEGISRLEAGRNLRLKLSERRELIGSDIF